MSVVQMLGKGRTAEHAALRHDRWRVRRRLRGGDHAGPQRREPVTGERSRTLEHVFVEDRYTVTGDWTDYEELIDLLQPPSWHARASCRRRGDIAWFSSGPRSQEAARAVCAGCEVREQCLAFAMALPDLVGVWGGTTEAERARIRRAVPVPPPGMRDCGYDDADRDGPERVLGSQTGSQANEQRLTPVDSGPEKPQQPQGFFVNR